MVRFHRLALREYRAALEGYARQSSVTAQRFEDAVDRAAARIAAAPEQGALFDRRHRWVGVGRFPFVLYYRVMADHVIVMAVAHGWRRTGYWLRRPIS